MSRRPLVFVSAAVLIAAGASAFAGQSSHGPALPVFGSPVVTDPFHPGFEPDIAIDRSVAHNGRAYVTWPNGFSTTVSYFLRSDDAMNSFHPIEANTAGKPLSCPGGGDTDIQVNSHDGQLFFADLQGLTNFSNATSTDGGKTLSISCTAVPGAGVDRQWIAIDNNGGTASIGANQGDGRTYFTYDNVAADEGNNQLVVNQSKDGYNYGGGAGCATPNANCVLPPAVVSKDEGIPGNLTVDTNRRSRFQHTVYIPHSNASGDGVLVDWCNGGAITRTAASVADACTDPTNFDPSDTHRVSPMWHDVTVSRTPGTSLAGFATMAIDLAGNLYVTWAQYPGTTPHGPGQVFLATSKDGGVHWSAPIEVSTPKTPTVVFPWVAAGDAGRIDIAWYGATQDSYKRKFGPDTLDNGTWNVYLAQSLNALANRPTFGITKVSDHDVKYGNISTAGLGGSPDRSLGDYLQVQSGINGEAVVSYVDDTSANRNFDACAGCGQTPAEAAGPTMLAKQTSGPSLYNTVGTINGATKPRYDYVTDPIGKATDAFIPVAGQDLAAPAALDVSRVSVTQVDAGHLAITLKTADDNLAQHLQVSPTLGGLTGDWIVRWAAPAYHHAGDGNMFYVGMESVLGQAPVFFTGTTSSITTTHAKYFVYGHDSTIPGVITGPRITWTVPLSLIDNPRRGQGLYSITGFTSVQLGPTVVGPTLPQNGMAGPYSPPNLVDAAPPFTYVMGHPGGAGASGVAAVLRSVRTGGAGSVALLALALALVTGSVVASRRLASPRVRTA